MKKHLTFKDIVLQSKNKDNLEIRSLSGRNINNNIVKGGDAMYTQLTLDKGRYGVKVIHPDRKPRDQFAYETPKDMFNHLKYIQNKDLEIFPKIYDVMHKEEDDTVWILMEHIDTPQLKDDYNKYDWLPNDDKEELRRDLQLPLSFLDEYNQVMLENGLIPDTSWMKANHNFIGDKIVDFHRFRYVPERYRFNSRGKSVAELKKLYEGFVRRYQAMPQSPPKWYRAGIYEGFRFDNGYEFKGYSSDGIEYDSYRKLNFQYLTLANNSTVLDIGSNQGFFCFQSVVHGAKKVVGIEKTKEDYQTAVDINDKIFKFDEIEFINGDAKKYVMETEEKFDIVIMNSVLHQLYPDFKTYDKTDNRKDVQEFMKKISKMTKFCMVFETPVDHPKMKLTLDTIKRTLKTWFPLVKITYVYDAYSSGYRAVFVCLKKT